MSPHRRNLEAKETLVARVWRDPWMTNERNVFFPRNRMACLISLGGIMMGFYNPLIRPAISCGVPLKYHKTVLVGGWEGCWL